MRSSAPKLPPSQPFDAHAALVHERAEAARLARIKMLNSDPLTYAQVLVGPLLFGGLLGVGASWVAVETGITERLSDGFWLMGVFYLVGLAIAAGHLYRKTRRQTPRPHGPISIPVEPPVHSLDGVAPTPSSGSGATGEPYSTWRAARLANLREERRQSTSGHAFVARFSPLTDAWLLCLTSLLFPAFATLLLVVSGSEPDAGAVGAALGFWALWSLTVVWVVRATRQRSRVLRQRAEVEALARRLGWQVGQGVGVTVMWLDAYWEAPVSPSLLRMGHQQWSMWGSLRGYPLFVDLNPLASRSVVPRFIAALAAYPPSGAGAPAWLGQGPAPTTPQLEWLLQLGLRVEHTEAGIFATGDRDFVREFELDPSSVPRLADIVRVMVEHAETLGALPRPALP
jgi:hypothetical protein